MARPTKASAKSVSAQPWAELYDLESRQLKRSVTGRGRGRPRNAIKRSTRSVRLSSDEDRAITRARLAIESILDERRVQKGQVLGLATRLLEHRLRQLTASGPLTWPELAAVVFEGEG
jgi:hypothetical protein